MKKIIFVLLAVLSLGNIAAQNSYDVTRFTNSDLTGTARFVGMGGAMSALGTDVSVISTNPAGIGLYRCNDFVATMGLHTIENKSNFIGNELKNDKTSFAIDNLGLVISNETGSENVKFVNMAFNYRHRNSFKNNMEIAGSLMTANGDYFSQQYELGVFYKESGQYVGYEDYYSLNYPWLGLLTSTSGLIGDDGNLRYVPGGDSGYYPLFMNYYAKEKGGIDDVDVNISCNISDRYYFGITVTASNVDYTRYSEYLEHDDLYDYYTIENRYNISGNGVGIKLGSIIRPFEYSPFKIGFAIHTPTWYNLTDRTSATMIGDDGYIIDTRDYEAYGDDLYIDYEYTTPWRLNLSASYTFDTFAAVNAEYEFVDYSSAKLKYTDGFNMSDLNDEIEANTKAQHILRIGAMFNLSKNLSLRCGYNYISAPFKNSAAKTCLKMQDTSTEFLNNYETNIFTLGTGYASGSFYFDIAYKMAVQKAEFYNYYDFEYVNPAAEVDVTRQSLVMSLGFRF